MRTGVVRAASAGRTGIGDAADARRGKIWMIDGHRSVDERNPESRQATSALHERPQLHQLEAREMPQPVLTSLHRARAGAWGI
jgi:hypothetical protein